MTNYYYSLRSLFFVFSIFCCLTLAHTTQAASFLDNNQNQGLNDVLNTVEEEPEFLPVDQAFIFDFQQSGDELTVSWSVADQYYLYKDKIKLVAKDGSLGEIDFPPSLTVEDEYFGTSSVYRNELALTMKVSDVGANGEVKIRYQGCADAGLCYPIVTKSFPLISSVGKIANAATSNNGNQTTAPAAPISEQNQLAKDIADGALIITLLSFFALGIGLAFTPCVFPMYPILSGIIAGRCDNMTTKYAFGLSFTYVQGMALTYTILGLVVASAGVKFQAYFQDPVVLIGLSILFVILSLSMFGVYQISLPASWSERMNSLSNKQKGGDYGGVFTMGAISGLVASPCTTAPLSGVLLYVAQEGDLLLGGLTLYVLSLGMGLPLLILGSSGGKWLPKSGAWMDKVKVVFGFLLLAVPLMLLERIVDAKYIYTAGAGLTVALCAYLYNIQLNLNNTKAKTALTFASLGLLFASGITIQQLWFTSETSTYTARAQQHTSEDAHGFIEVSSLAELKQLLEYAQTQNKPVMVDLYADWCVACKEFEKYTFTDPEVQKQMSQFVLLRADVTQNNDTDIELLEAYSVLGLPTLMFFDTQSNELTKHRVTGFMKAEKFNQHLLNLLQ